MRMTQADVDAYEARRNAKKQQPVLAGVDKEADLHEQINEECKRRGWIALHGSMAHRTFRTAGEPDYLVIADNSRLFMVECKTRTGKLSLEQVGMMAHAHKLGHTIHVVRSLVDFIKVVDNISAT